MSLLRFLRKAIVATAVASLAPPTVWAGRPLSTEDAGVLDAGRCQLESWIDRTRDASKGWLVPSCNFGAGVEWQVGAARTREAGASRFSDAYFQAKATLAANEARGIAAGLVAGVTRDPLNETRRGWSNPYVIVPITTSLGAAQVHLNVGWSRDKASRRDVTTWGLGAEWPIERWTAVAEMFGENSERPWVRAGFRWTAVPDALDIDLTWVAQPGGDRSERHVSLGFTFVTPPFGR